MKKLNVYQNKDRVRALSQLSHAGKPQVVQPLMYRTPPPTLLTGSSTKCMTNIFPLFSLVSNLLPKKGKDDGVSTSSPHSSSLPSPIEGAPVSAADHSPPNEAAPSNARWFHLDDAKVKSVREEELKSQFSGKESAYMLFYRR